MKTYQEFLEKKGEAKWQKKWEKKKLFKTPEEVTPDNKYYILPQLPYPSGSGLHVGHAEVYSACDIYARYQRMKGKKVLQAIGWDSFGLPAENYAIKNNVHPKISTDKAVKNFREQIKSLGISVDWDREVGAHNSDYYKWTQWFFLLFYKRGLVYRKKQAVNWCESCKTVLANDQVTPEGHCERCDTQIIQKDMEQWYIKVTEYADRLLEGLDKIDWPEETKKRQRDWIGRSSGASIKFKVESRKDFEIEIFTTRPDTLFGATYMVLAPEGQYVQDLKDSIENWDEVEKYIEATSKKTELDRQIDKEKTGVELKGIKAINPVNGEEIPVWTADYVMASYGSGAIMAVPAHDERDFEFAKKFGIEIREVISGGDISKEAFVGDGKLVNSDFINDSSVDDAKTKMIEWLEEKNIGKGKVQYKLRDWSVSRQRFWGAPIPMLQNEEIKNKKYNYIFVHGYTADKDAVFWSWLEKEIKEKGHSVWRETLPNTDSPNAKEQADFILNNTDIGENTVIVCHSHGGPTVFRLLEKTNSEVAKVLFVDTFVRPEFVDNKRPAVEKSDDYNFDFKNIKKKANEFVVLHDELERTIAKEQAQELGSLLDAKIVYSEGTGPEDHFCEKVEPDVLNNSFVDYLKPVPEQDLPVLLPEDVDFKPTGESPLNYSEEFKNRAKEKYGDEWKYEPDTLDTFMCSSWYYFRYLDPKNGKEFASPEALKKWMPVDFYLGGPEHVNGHLLYSRFFTKVLFDEGLIDFDEPFKVHRHQGLILGPDNRKMSKRWGNTINPTDIVNQYGADTIRMYEMFMGPLEDDKPWNENGVKGVRRFLDKVWKLQSKIKNSESEGTEEINKLTHKAVKKVGEDLDTLGFNTAIAEMMKLVNEMSKQEKISIVNYQLLITMLVPFAPHMCEELWKELGNKDFVCTQEWPEYDPELIKDDQITVVVQINGKLRGEMTVSADISEDDAKAQALQIENVVKWLEGKEPKKVIYVKGKLVSIVV